MLHNVTKEKKTVQTFKLIQAKMNIIKAPQDNIEAYLCNNYNIELFESITDPNYNLGLFEPLEFFNLLYLEYDTYCNNINDYIFLKTHFKKYSISSDIDLSFSQKEYFLQMLYCLIDENEIDNKGQLIEKLSYEFMKFVEKPPTELAPNNKHENIFCNNGFELFEYILNQYVKQNRGRQNDLIYYQRKMYNDKYIHQKPTEFFKWFENNYAEVIEQTKTLKEVENPQRNKDYSNALDWFKLQNQ